MDPTSALGAAAASAQFLGYGIKGLVYAAQLLRDIKGAPDDSLRIVSRLEREIASMNRLLSPDSSTFSQFTTAQYVHIAPWALEARKALDEANKILSPLSTQLGELNNQDGAENRVLRIWKSLLTVKAVRDVEKQMETIQVLNASLIRELNVADFETQYLLQEQSVEVLAKVNEITTMNDQLQQNISDLSRQHSKVSEMVMASSASVSNGLELLDQANEQRQVGLAQMMSSVNDEMSAVRIGLQVVDDTSRALNLSMERVETTVTGQNVLLATQLRNFIRVQGAENQKVLVGEIKDMLVTELLTTVHHFAGDRQDSAQTGDFLAQLSAMTRNTKFNHTIKSPDFIRCLCMRGKFTTSETYGLFRFKIDHQDCQVCPLHGRIARHSYSLTTKLSPWLNGALELTLSALHSNASWSILPSLIFHGTVKRSESPIYQLFDSILAAIPRDDLATRKKFWKRPKTKKDLSNLICGIKQAVTLRSASCSDVDEHGNNLLTDTAYLMSLMADNLPCFTDEICTLLRFSQRAQVDPTASMEFHLGFRPMIFTGVCGLINLYELPEYFLDTAIYNAILEYDEIVQELQANYSEQGSDDKTTYLDWLIKDPDFAAGAGYSAPIYQAILRRSLDGLQRYFPHSRTFEVSTTESRTSLLSMAVGWPDGLQYLVDYQDHLDLFALKIATERKDVRSVEIILSADSTRLFPLGDCFRNFKIDSNSHLYSSILRYCEKDLFIFRQATEKLWDRYDDFRRIILDSFRTHLDAPHSDENRCYKGLVFLNYDLYCLLSEKSENPERLEELDPFISTSLYYGPVSSYLQIKNYHQILHDTGFVHIDSVCGRIGSPLAYHCRCFIRERRFPVEKDDEDDLYDRVWWFLSKGAEPSFWFWRGSEDKTRWPHLQFYVAATMSDSYHLSHKLLGVCGQEYVRDDCVCACSTRGCIPPFKFWAICKTTDLSEGYEHQCHSQLSHRWTHLTHWSSRLNRSASRREHTYREICRLELFDRLGLKHSCCMGADCDARERKRFRREDAKSRKQLELLMKFYKNIRGLLPDLSVEEFWPVWWAAADAVVLPFLPAEACSYPEWDLPIPNAVYLYSYDVKRHINSLAVSREDRWADMLRSSGYKGWDYQDVIKHHFSYLQQQAKEHKQRKQSYKRHRLMLKPKFVGLRRRNNSKYRKADEWEWVAGRDDE